MAPTGLVIGRSVLAAFLAYPTTGYIGRADSGLYAVALSLELMESPVSVLAPMPRTLGLYRLSSRFLGRWPYEAVAGGTGAVV